MADAEVDPRFDPRYQRGFDPAVHPVAADPRRPSLSRPTPERPAPEHPPSPQVTVPPDIRRSSLSRPSPEHPDLRESRAPQPGLDRLDQRPDKLDHDDDLDDLEPPRLNPYRLALLLISVAALVAAGVSFGVSASRQATGFAANTLEQIVLFQVVATVPAPLISAGVLGLVLWIASGAFLGRGRRDG